MAPRAHATVVVVLAAVGLLGGCTRDFDGLLTKPADNGSTSGNPGTDNCACSACTGTSCDFECPKGCASCSCNGFICSAGSACDVTCGDGADCTVKCEKGSQCDCAGTGCNVSCGDGTSPQSCAKSVVCNRDCP
jgi:hypothetical protein